MQDEEVQTVTLQDTFYRDSFKPVLVIGFGALLMTVLLAGLAVYYATSQPWPVVFAVEQDWEVQPSVSILRPFISEADLLQWVNDVVPALFTLNYLTYDNDINAQKHNFTDNGWHVYENQLRNFAPHDLVTDNGTFLHANATDAPVIDRQGILTGRYAWSISLPIAVKYDNVKQGSKEDKRYVTFQLLVVRVPTEVNLSGIAIHDIVVAKNA